MYIEFSLPSGAGGMAAAYTASAIKNHLAAWSEKYDVEILAIKAVRYGLRVTFKDPKYYDFFALTWDPQTNNQLKSWIIKYKFVEPMDPPKSVDDK